MRLAWCFALVAALPLTACENKITGKLRTGLDGGIGSPDATADGGLEPDGGTPLLDAAALDAAPLDGGQTDTGLAADSGVPAADGGVPDAGPCSGTLASALSLTPLMGVPETAWATPLQAGGFVTAWASGSMITLRRYDGSGAAVGSAMTIPGDGLYGLAASVDAYGLLVSRDDVLALVTVGFDGTPRVNHTIMGGVDHSVTNNEWFGIQLRAGRLDWTGAEWAAYSTVQRLWPDGVAHYGDQLRTFQADGTLAATYWDWGCSHSMDVRLTHNTGSLGPVCSSDCYPDKGIFFMHDRATVYLDASGNCAGYVAQELGGVVGVTDAFFVGFVSGQGRASKDAAIVRVGNDLTVGPVLWLTDTAGDETQLHLGRLGTGLVAAWISGGSGYVTALDATGASKGAPEAIPAAAVQGAGDMFPLAGDTAWLVGGQLARLHYCP